MDNYLLSNSQIRNFMERMENINLIEEALAELYTEYIPLKEDFEKRRIRHSPIRHKSLEDLISITHTAIEETSNFLDVHPYEKPNIKIVNKNPILRLISHISTYQTLGQYDEISKTIDLVVLDSIESFFLVACHEYTHFLQHITLKTNFESENSDKFLYLLEGHAVGVENSVGKQFSEKTNNPALRYFSLDNEITSLKKVYLYYSIILDFPVKDSLLMDPSGNFRRRFYDDLNEGEPMDEYTLGSVYFKILEKKEGPAVYKKILQTFMKVNSEIYENELSKI
ncbi:MAG: hypothetical protein QXJ50_00725 [Candidatus Woesearchaeota archaeon]